MMTKEFTDLLKNTDTDYRHPRHKKQIENNLGVVVGHLALVSFFIVGSFLVPLLLLFIWESLELFGDNASDVTETGIWIIFFDLGTSIHRIKEVGRHVAFRRVGIALLLLLASTFFFCRNVVLHLFLVADLVLLGFLCPLLHFFVTKRLVLRREDSSLFNCLGILARGRATRALVSEAEFQISTILNNSKKGQSIQMRPRASRERTKKSTLGFSLSCNKIQEKASEKCGNEIRKQFDET